ncbi:MAG: DUF481 domain-containing protein [Ferruginibacter sp.]
MKRSMLLVAAVFYIGFCNAQILTIDKTDTSDYTKQTRLKGNLSVGIEGDKQKKLLLDGSNAFDVQLRQYKELLILAASYRFTYNGNQDYLNSGYVHLRWRHNYKNTWQPETFVQYQWNNSRGLLHRLTTGLNARYNYWNKNNQEFSVASGVMYESETWNYTAVDSALKPAIQTNKVTSLLKSNNYVRWEGKTSPNSSISAVVFLQLPFNDLFNQYRLASNINFTVNFAKHFDFGFSFSSMYDSKPVVPILKFYYNFSNNIVYKF